MSNINEDTMKKRTKQFALRTIQLAESFYWMELIIEVKLMSEPRVSTLLNDNSFQKGILGTRTLRNQFNTARP